MNDLLDLLELLVDLILKNDEFICLLARLSLDWTVVAVSVVVIICLLVMSRLVTRMFATVIVCRLSVNHKVQLLSSV